MLNKSFPTIFAEHSELADSHPARNTIGIFWKSSMKSEEKALRNGRRWWVVLDILRASSDQSALKSQLLYQL